MIVAFSSCLHLYSITEMAIFNIFYVQRAATPKVSYPELLFCILHVVSRCFTFVRNCIIMFRTVFNLQSGHEYMIEMVMFNFQRAITQKE